MTGTKKKGGEAAHTLTESKKEGTCRAYKGLQAKSGQKQKKGRLKVYVRSESRLTAEKQRLNYRAKYSRKEFSLRKQLHIWYAVYQIFFFIFFCNNHKEKSN